ncbi:transcriptional regulatory protein AlgP-like isoform X4 [Trematomus bernacchii]|uniref:transcriptional regulatory protein AlgP-like isoform X4 n=1 Tax=Trematomus bernacchii TaxID=40690 RepID=UPI00146F41BA|nr:transcriptional regulatory protein AlgP-like isoform X4 [Trematomus bernacchii]
MDLMALETKWRTALSSILHMLMDDEFQKLLFNLQKIPQGVKGGRPRGDMPSVIIQHYGTEGSITLIDRLMKILPRLDAAVQQPLRGMKDELKKLREKSKGTTSAAKKRKAAAGTKPAADSGAATKKKKPAAAATSNATDSGAATNKRKPAAGTKPAADSGAATKKKKPAARTKPAADSGAATKKKKPAAEVSGGSRETQIRKQDSTLKLALNPQTPQVEDVLGLMDPFGGVKLMGRDSTPNPAWFLPTLKPAGFFPNPKKVPVGAVEPQQKVPVGATQKPKDQSAAPVQIRKIEVITLLRTNNTNTHLKVQLGGRLRNLYGTTQVLSEGMGFKTVEEFTKLFFHMLPLTVTANMQGKRILEMRMI